MALLSGTMMEKKENALWRWVIEDVDLHMVNQGVPLIAHLCIYIELYF